MPIARNPQPRDPTSSAVNRVKKDDEKARPHAVLNIGKEPATVITAMVLSGCSTKNVWGNLTSGYKKNNIQSKRDHGTKLHNLAIKTVQIY